MLYSLLILPLGLATQLSFVRQRHLFPTGHKKPTIGRSFGHTSIDYDEKASAEVKRGGVVKKWEQTYNGIPVYGSIVTTHHNKQGLSLSPC